MRVSGVVVLMTWEAEPGYEPDMYIQLESPPPKQDLCPQRETKIRDPRPLAGYWGKSMPLSSGAYGWMSGSSKEEGKVEE